MLAVLVQNTFVGMATAPDDAKMLLDIPFPMNHVIIDQLALNLINIYLDNTVKKDIMQIVWGRLSFQKFPKFGSKNFPCSISK